MQLKTYKKYLIKNFISILAEVTAIFFVLIFILNLLEEINFFKSTNEGFYYPIILTLLNTPSTLYDVFPFIFLITTQFFFLKMTEKNEVSIFKNYGISNFQILSLLVITSFVLSILINTVFYNLTSNLKYTYLNLKNNFSNDNKYLAVINDNGLWIKDEINSKIHIISSAKLVEDTLFKVQITQFNNNFELIKTIYAEKANIKNKTWKIANASISGYDNSYQVKKELNFETNFNSIKLNSYFGNLQSLSFFELLDAKKNYNNLGYSTEQIETQLQKIYTYPFYLTIMTLFSCIIMFNIKHNKPKIFHLIIGIMLSVIIYYINLFSNVLGQSLDLSSKFSSIVPLIIIGLFCGVGLVTIDEK